VQGGPDEIVADTAATPAQSITLAAPVDVAPTPVQQVALDDTAKASRDYVTPQPGSATNLAQNASLANYVVAHSEFSGPISRRMALLGVLASENGASAAQPEPADAAAETPDAP